MRISDRMFYIEWGYDGICIINMAFVFVKIGGYGGYFQVATKNGREIMINSWSTHEISVFANPHWPSKIHGSSRGSRQQNQRTGGRCETMLLCFIPIEFWTKLNRNIHDISGWWFGTFFNFSIQLGMSSSQLTNSYFSEGSLNYQPDIHDCTVWVSSANFDPRDGLIKDMALVWDHPWVRNIPLTAHIATISELSKKKHSGDSNPEFIRKNDHVPTVVVFFPETNPCSEPWCFKNPWRHWKIAKMLPLRDPGVSYPWYVSLKREKTHWSWLVRGIIHIAVLIQLPQCLN